MSSSVTNFFNGISDNLNSGAQKLIKIDELNNLEKTLQVIAAIGLIVATAFLIVATINFSAGLLITATLVFIVALAAAVWSHSINQEKEKLVRSCAPYISETGADIFLHLLNN